MPVSYSYNRIRNAELYQQWKNLPDSSFAELGVARDDIKTLQNEIQGHIVLPGAPDYNKDRMLSNPLFNYFPAMIVYCVVESDVTTVLAYARKKNSQFMVRSGGHCTAGFSSGPGILIDVSNLDSIVIDALDKTAVVGCGVKFGNLNNELNSYGLHVPGGECPDVCVGGYMQGGGFGFTSVTHGMNCDNVISIKVLLADGSVVVASKQQNYDLWWAIRGGTGGNFGIVLSIKYQLVELDDVFGFALIWPMASRQDIENAASAMMLMQEQYMLDSLYGPNLNLQVSLCYQTKVMPTDPTGDMKPYFMVRGLYVGSEKEGLAAIAALQKVPGCVTQWTLVRPFNKMNKMLLEYPQEMPVLPSEPTEEKASRYVEQMLTHDEWAGILAYFLKAEVNTAYMYLEFYGGRINGATHNENAFIHRNVAYNAVMDVFWFKESERPAAVKFLQGWKDLMKPVWNGHVYQNYPSLDTEDYAYAYWGHAVFALTMAKEKYDPDNAFSFAQQVPGIIAGSDQQASEIPHVLQQALSGKIDHTGGIRPVSFN